ncbi:MAG: HicB-like domain-containing protein [Lactococcus sp.]|jgi:antitoxin HicB
MKIQYFATLYHDGDYIGVKFSDIEGLVTFGTDYQDAVKMAQEALEGWLLVAEDFKDEIPTPSLPDAIDLKKSESLVMLQVDTQLIRDREDNKLVKKTLTIPNYLNILGNDAGVNFSQLLTDTLKKELVN